jgi:cytochrome c oxidase subunit I
MTTTALFRVCPRTGLQFHKSAETLIKLNAVAAVVALLIGGVLALLITLTRWQAIHLVNAENFYLYLTAHGLDMLAVWIIFFEIAILYFCSSTLLRCRLATPRLAWLAFALMVIGTLTFNAAVFTGVLPRLDSVRGGGADRLLHLPRHAGGGQGREDL